MVAPRAPEPEPKPFVVASMMKSEMMSSCSLVE